MNLLAVIIALYSFIIASPQIPQTVKDEALVVMVKASIEEKATTTPIVKAPVRVYTPTTQVVEPVFVQPQPTPVINTPNTQTIISVPVMAVPVEPPAPSYSIDSQKCVVNRRVYGTTAPQALYEITPSTGFNKAIIRANVSSTDNTTSQYNTMWTPYNTPQSSPWYDTELSTIKASINGLNNNDIIEYTVYLYNNGDEVNQFTGRLQFHTCQ